MQRELIQLPPQTRPILAVVVHTEEEFDWEEVEVPEHQHLEITLHAGKVNTGQKTNKLVFLDS